VTGVQTCALPISFYDYSPNRSAAWCSMQLCGNRAKTRAYRRRRR
jgi:predicted RNA-binding Zn ribbon-like protein